LKKFDISYSSTGYFSDLVCDYLDNKKSLNSFFNLFPSYKNIYDQAAVKQKSFSNESRKTLVNSLKNQYLGIDLSKEVKSNLDLLEGKSTFTITTGHQLNIMTGPLYFVYKIITAIKLSMELNKKYRKVKFVPVYWMATEDHDFEEISFFVHKGKNYKWAKKNGTEPVGDILTDDLKETLDLFEKELGDSPNENQLKKLIKLSYRSGKNLSQATRTFVNHLFGRFGLIIFDGNDKNLKKNFVPHFQEEITKKTCHKYVAKQIYKLKEKYNSKYKPQINPREINLFHMAFGKRLRIVDDNSQSNKNEGVFYTYDFINEIKNYPERFSPNALMRPLYQEVILPNVAYVGGQAELAYWFQLKGLFDFKKIPFPVLCLRNSAVLIDNKSLVKSNKLGLKTQEFFLKKEVLTKKKVFEISKINLDLSFLKKQLVDQFNYLEKIASKTDASFLGALSAQKKKQLNGIEKLEKRLIKAEKIKFADELERLYALRERFFPKSNLQERIENFTTFYLQTGDCFFDLLLDSFEPINHKFTFIQI
jgi:bacillithiol synthase